MNFKTRLSHKVMILVAIPLVFQLVFVVVLSALLNQAEDAEHTEYVAKNAIAEATELWRRPYDEVNALLAYVLTHDKSNLTRMNDSIHQFKRTLESLKLKVIHHPAQLARLRRMDLDHDLWGQFLRKAMEQTEQEGKLYLAVSGKDLRQKLAPLTNDLMENAHDFIKEEQRFEREKPETEERYRNMVRQLLYACVPLNVLIGIGLMLVFNRDVSRRLDVLMANTKRLAHNEPLIDRPQMGSDEIAELDAVFREMADALSEALSKERAIIQNAADAIGSINADGIFAALSPASLGVFGYGQNELIGRQVLDIIAEESHVTTKSWIEDVRTKASTASLENRTKRPDGSLADILWSGQWSNKENALFFVAHNVTEKRELDRLKQQFVAMVSHDLRTPLTSMDSFLEILKEGIYGSLNPGGHSRVSLMKGEIARLINLINGLLDLEKIEAGRLELYIEKAMISTIIERSIAAVSSSAELAGISFKQTGVDLEVLADQERLVQVVVNILSNAVKYSPSSGVVTIDVERSNGFATVGITDQGRGIPAAYQKSVFERFEQVRSEKAGSKGGTGLGLAICKAVIEQHGGKIGIVSEEGQGCTCWFSIPISQT